MKADCLAKEIFEHGISSLMSHTIRGIERGVFNKIQIPLFIKISPRGVAKNFQNRKIPSKMYPSFRANCLFANIKLDEDLTPDGARLVICHELYHVLKFIELFEKTEKSQNLVVRYNDALIKFNTTKTSEQEQKATQFALDLCRHHCRFLYDENGKYREKFKRLDKNFKEPLSASDIDSIIRRFSFHTDNINEKFSKHHSFGEIFEDPSLCIKDKADRFFI